VNRSPLTSPLSSFIFLYGLAATLCLTGAPLARAAPSDAITTLAADGVTIAILGGKPAAPAPTVFIFSMDRRTSLENPSFARSGHLLRESDGVLCVSLDVPAHGDDARPAESGLPGWKARLARNENLVATFTRQASLALDYLVRQGYSDSKRIAVIGVSRGGFLALHFMAADSRVAAVAALAPVTHLPTVTEFAALKNHPLTESLSILHLVPKLAARPIWIVVGNRDERVGTDNCINLMQALYAATPAGMKLCPAELHLLPGENHRQPPNSHEAAAAWLSKTIRKR